MQGVVESFTFNDMLIISQEYGIIRYLVFLQDIITQLSLSIFY